MTKKRASLLQAFTWMWRKRCVLHRSDHCTACVALFGPQQRGIVAGLTIRVSRQAADVSIVAVTTDNANARTTHMTLIRRRPRSL